jgi:uncharacterized repeat protein (TIGR02543 family)
MVLAIIVVLMISLTVIACDDAKDPSLTVIACDDAKDPSFVELSKEGSYDLSQNSINLQNEETPAEVKYIISFETDSSQVIPNMELLTMSASQVPTLTNAVKPGYRFEGWYLTAECVGAKLNFPYTFHKNTTLYAKWVPNATVRIGTPEDLMEVKNDLAGSYILTRNIDLAEYGIWEPIGDRLEPFTGVFDGNGYVINNMKIEELEEDEEFNELPIGLFGRVTGHVKNVTLTNYKIKLEGEKSRFMIGGIIGHLDGGSLLFSQSIGTLLNSEMSYRKRFVDTFWVTAKPSTKVSLGGAVGKVDNNGVVTGVSTEGTITSYSNAIEIYTGGVVGHVVSGRITECNSAAKVYGKAAGGLIGLNDGNVDRCFASGEVSGSLSYPSVIGGLASYNQTSGTITRSYATGAVRGRTAGGLVGVNKFDYETAIGGRITHCYAKGNVFGSEYAGGLLGRHTSDIPYFGWDDYSGLIFDPVGQNDRPGISFNAISNCLAFGDVTANASETVYEKTYVDDEGVEHTEEHRILGVFYSVFAGGLVGQANEILIGNCIAFGDVKGISHRQLEEDGEINAKNPAHVNNFIGHSTNSTQRFQHVYAIEGQEVKRNDEDYTDYSTVATITFSEVNEGARLDAMGFDDTIWALTGLNIEGGVYPTLLM